MEEKRSGLQILTLADLVNFETWLDGQDTDAPGVRLKLAKKNAPELTLAKSKAIDTALCHGWIDGQLDKYDAYYWLVRFTPRVVSVNVV